MGVLVSVLDYYQGQFQNKNSKYFHLITVTISFSTYSLNYDLNF